jgi:hypothetical protein
MTQIPVIMSWDAGKRQLYFDAHDGSQSKGPLKRIHAGI